MSIRDVRPTASVRSGEKRVIDTNYAYIGGNRALAMTFFGRMIMLDPRLVHQFTIIMHGIYEPATCSVFEAILRPGDVVVDAGANIGFLSLYAAELVGPAGRVYAFEPNPSTFEMLRKSIVANALRARIKSSAVALGSAPGAATLTWREGQHGGANLFGVTQRADAVHTVQVEVDTLDNRLRDEKRPVRLLKIDTEGYEFAVLEGARALLDRSPDAHVVMEWNPGFVRRSGLDPAELARELGRRFRFVRAVSDVFRFEPLDFENLPQLRHAIVWLGNSEA